MTAFPYDTGYDPALPVCDIVMSAESTGRQLQLTAIIDTGADGTIIPIRHLQESVHGAFLRPGSAASGANDAQYSYTWSICRSVH